MAIDDAFLGQLAALFPGGEDSSWYVYAALVFQANDRMDLISKTWDHVASNTKDEKEQVTKARKLREALLKASVLVGFPKGINACTALRTHLQQSHPSIESLLDGDPSLRSSLSRDEKNSRGHAFFSRIYAQHTDRVLHAMSLASGGDLAEFAISAVYGDLMAETSRLDARDTGLLEFLACYAMAGSAWAQAKGHMYGSRNLGNDGQRIRAAVKICDRVEEGLGVRVERSGKEWEWLAKAEGW